MGIATAITDDRGIYRFPALPPGVYQVSATLQGFTPAKAENIELQLGQILKLDLSLAVGALNESVQVTAESPVIDVKQNSAAATDQRRSHRAHPEGRATSPI